MPRQRTCVNALGSEPGEWEAGPWRWANRISGTKVRGRASACAPANRIVVVVAARVGPHPFIRERPQVSEFLPYGSGLETRSGFGCTSARLQLSLNLSFPRRAYHRRGGGASRARCFPERRLCIYAVPHPYPGGHPGPVALEQASTPESHTAGGVRICTQASASTPTPLPRRRETALTGTLNPL